MRIALQQPGRHDDVHEWVAVAGNKSVAGGIKALAELADTSEWFIDERLRMKAAVLSLGNDRLAFWMQRAGHAGIGESTGDVHPAIGPERGAGDTELFAAALGAEPGQDNLPHIRAPIAVGVLQIPNIRRARDEHAAFPRQDAIGKRETLGKSGALFELPVAIGILQQRNPAKFRDLLAVAGQKRVPRAFDHQHSSFHIKTHRHRIAQLRLGRGNFDARPFLDLEQLQRLRHGRRPFGGQHAKAKRKNPNAKTTHDPMVSGAPPNASAPGGASSISPFLITVVQRTQRGNNFCTSVVEKILSSYKLRHAFFETGGGGFLIDGVHSCD